ncbi:MAG: DUF4296 domain-containing protein [Bacteroidetes bacterium]|nr:DUF4296 domain-containing protein [Bacteroidota bacterium]MCL1968068.1 DUF4296 domain-containing protein [Bacteroidota bacterium]
MNPKSLLKVFFFLLIGSCACINPSTHRISHKLPLDSVAVWVADCYFLEGEIYAKQYTYDMRDYATVKYEDFFAKHGITKEIFVENVQYYFTNEKYAEKIMNKVDDIVEQRVAALRDSLNVKP